MKRSVSSAWNSRLFLMPASVSAGDLLLVALKMPPSRIGTYSNLAPVRFSIAGIASWLRKALGLPKSNMNCGADVLTALSLASCHIAAIYMIPIIPISVALHSFGINRTCQLLCQLLLPKRPFRQPCGVVADVRRPSGDQLPKTPRIRREQRADSLFEMRLVAGHRRHETIGRLLAFANAILVLAAATRVVDQLPDRHRCAAGLPRQPFPVPRQQGDLARDHAELWTAGAAARRRYRPDIRSRGGCRQPRQHVIDAAAKIQIDRVAGRAVEDQHSDVIVAVERLFGRPRHLVQIAGGNPAIAAEGDKGRVGRRIHRQILWERGLLLPG